MNEGFYFEWNPDTELFSIFRMPLRYYSLMWLIGLAIGYVVVKKLYKHQYLPDQVFAPLYLYCFLGILLIYYKKGTGLHKGFYFGFCLTTIFIFRFFVEFRKERQVDFESAMILDMGQLLSIPFILIGLFCMFYRKTDTIWVKNRS
ncbi:MAG: prolipoprotein diacylglyceryl transferase [Tannerella sp.]|jgi:prolipoprotein diacylglyceryltransferase|nr:prolipoprotein diacylglyceryl transferase [Tannerella sp.]